MGDISVDKPEFLDRLATEIDRRIPKDANRKAWLRRRALDHNLSYETLLCYVAGENEPGILNWRKLCRIFPELEYAVFGTNSDFERQLADIRKDIKALSDKHVKGEIISLQTEGKVS